MELNEYTKEIQNLKSSISKLEKSFQQFQQSTNQFGRSYSTLGSSNSDLLLKTKGQVKIQWGSKFIDLIKEGKINSECKFIYSDSEVGVKDGIYVINNGQQVILKIKDTQIDLLGSSGNTYVSFMEYQETTPEQKHTALKNIGFLYNNIEEITETSLQNGIIYIESEQKLYTIKDGVPAEFSMQIQTPYPKQFVIAKQDEEVGALVIEGSGLQNSISFKTAYIYIEDSKLVIRSDGGISLKIGEQEVLSIDKNYTKVSNTLISNNIQSDNANSNYGFRLYMSNNESTLEIDNLIVRNNSDSENNMLYPQFWYYRNNIIQYAALVDSSSYTYNLQLLFQNQYEVGDLIYSYVQYKDSSSETYQQVFLPFKVLSIDTSFIQTILLSDYISSDITSSISLDSLESLLQGSSIFMVGTESSDTYIMSSSEEGLSISNSRDFSESSTILSRFGNLSNLNINERNNGQENKIQGYGVYSGNAAFLKAQYTSQYTLPINDYSTKFASTEWVNNVLNSLFPKGTIIMFNGLSSAIPDGWAICDGNNGTPNLIGKFIKASSQAGEQGGSNEVTIGINNLPSHSHTITPSSLTTTSNGSHSHELGYSNYSTESTGQSISVLNGELRTNTLAAGEHNHTIDLSSLTISETGQGQPIQIQPQYYSLIYIMKL